MCNQKHVHIVKHTNQKQPLSGVRSGQGVCEQGKQRCAQKRTGGVSGAKARVQVGGINIVCQVSGGTGDGKDIAGLGPDILLTQCKAFQKDFVDHSGCLFAIQPMQQSIQSSCQYGSKPLPCLQYPSTLITGESCK